MEKGGIGQQGLKELGNDSFRDITLKELDKYVQGHGQDVLNTYLGWLQEQLNDWDLSDSAVLRPQIDSWCASLRFHGLDDQSIFDAFAVWKIKEIENDASNARRFLVTEEELRSVLSLEQAIDQSSPEVKQGQSGIITVQDEKSIDVSSGTENSEVEFLGWKDPSNKHNTTKTVHNTNAESMRSTVANQENQPMHRDAYGDRNASTSSIRSKNRPGNRQGKGPLPREYVCNRCRKKGHHVEDCPTNLDPSYDQIPEHGYKCYCCGAQRQHLTTLCPGNRNPQSLTQQRIRAGIITDEPSASMASDHYRPTYSKPHKRERELSGDVDANYIHEDRRALMKLDDDDLINPNRRALSERPDHHRQSPQPDMKTGSNRGSHYSPPPSKRRRMRNERQLERQRERIRRSNQKSNKPSSQPQSSGKDNEDSTGLLPQVIHHSSKKDGRLSPWDEGDAGIDLSNLHLYSSKKRPLDSDFCESAGPEAALQLLFPDADPPWVSDMVNFDVDKFFDELDVFMENRAVSPDSRETKAGPDLKLCDIKEDEASTLSKADKNQTHRTDVGHKMEVYSNEGRATSKSSSSPAHGADLESTTEVGRDGHQLLLKPDMSHVEYDEALLRLVLQEQDLGNNLL
ncbi:Protein MPE1 [Cytospora mali]|uniref:Protein MPE1 n=1 Tax=Cytospora mali TaxID=578113 RepID=A0A194UT61_CYTMA|nr:Protein MPE1 [Valsa mali var. pyri (nom. inval.)]